MPEVKLFYPNCNCCSGSGSGSGSCGCSFFSSLCPSAPVYLGCDTTFSVTVRFSFSACVHGSLGSCGSGSSGGGPSTGGDFEPTGSSGSDCSICPSCCDLIPRTITFSLACIGSILTTTNMVSATGACTDPSTNEEGGSCKGYRTDRCPYFQLASTGSGQVWIPVDSGGIYGTISLFSLDACNPLQITGSISFSNATVVNGSGGEAFAPCLAACVGLDGTVYDWDCITATFTITE